jgi:hypothetical protein
LDFVTFRFWGGRFCGVGMQPYVLMKGMEAKLIDEKAMAIVVSRTGRPFFHLALAAFSAILRRWSGDRVLARATRPLTPPLWPRGGDGLSSTCPVAILMTWTALPTTGALLAFGASGHYFQSILRQRM